MNSAYMGLIFSALVIILAIMNTNFFFNLYTVRRLSKYITRRGTRILMGLMGIWGICYNIEIIL